MFWDDALVYAVLGLIALCGYVYNQTKSRRIKARAEQGDPRAQWELSKLYGDGLRSGTDSYVPRGDKQNYVPMLGLSFRRATRPISTYDFDFPDYKERLKNKLR